MDERLLRAQARADWRQQQDPPGGGGMLTCASSRVEGRGRGTHAVSQTLHAPATAGRIKNCACSSQ
jgi:hypothetical protein